MREVLSAGKKLLREHKVDEESAIRDKMEALKQDADCVAKESAERLSRLQQAVPLAAHFHDTHGDLQTWFDEVEPALVELEVMAINADHVKQQQEKAKVRYICLNFL